MSESDLYRPLQQALEAVGAAPGAAESHGLLCGMLSVSDEESNRARWIAHVLDGTHPRGEEAKRCLEVLSTVFDRTGEALQDPELRFQPLLPGDETDVGGRAHALGDWCQGYLAGLGLGGLQSREALSGEAAEILRDFAEIAQVDPETAAEEDNESAYAELTEYVRMGAMLLMENVRAPSRPPRNGDGKRSRRLH